MIRYNYAYTEIKFLLSHVQLNILLREYYLMCNVKKHRFSQMIFLSIVTGIST